MTSARGSRAVGRHARGDDGKATPSGNVGQADTVIADAATANSSPGDTALSEPAAGASAGGAPIGGAPAGAAPADGASVAPARESSAWAGLGQAPSDQAGLLWRWAKGLPSAVAFLVCLWGIARPSYWRDEAATIAAIKRPLGDLIAMLGNVDAVHAAYYLMMWPIEHVLGSGELVLRLPSAVAAAVGAAAVAATGRRLITPLAGVSAGLLYALLPVTSRYGQEVR